MNENDDVNQQPTSYNQPQIQPQSQSMDQSQVLQSQSQLQSQIQNQPQYSIRSTAKHGIMRVIGIALLVISILLGLQSTHIIIRIVGCKVSGCGDAVFLLIPTLVGFLSLLVLSIFLIFASSKKAQKSPKTLYIVGTILFGELGIHDFIANRKKQAFLHLSLICLSIVLMILGGIHMTRPLTDEECIRDGGTSRLDCEGMVVLEYIPGAPYFTLASSILPILSYIWALAELRYSKQLPASDK